MESQNEFQDFLIAYLAKLKEEKLQERPKILPQSPLKAQARMNSTRGSFLSLGFRRADSFQSFPGFVEGAYQTLGDGVEQLKQEAAQVTSAMKSRFVAYVTGFNQPVPT